MPSLSALVEIRQGMAMSGRAAGARSGDWRLKVIESSDLVGDQIEFDALKQIHVKRGAWSERHLLRPYDVLLTARSRTPKAAIVPPSVSRTVASSTLLIVRAQDPSTGLAHFLWYYFLSAIGRAAIGARISNSTLPTLTAKSLGQIAVAIPPDAELRRFVSFVEAAEESRMASREAARDRHETLRDAVIARLIGNSARN